MKEKLKLIWAAYALLCTKLWRTIMWPLKVWLILAPFPPMLFAPETDVPLWLRLTIYYGGFATAILIALTIIVWFNLRKAQKNRDVIG